MKKFYKLIPLLALGVGLSTTIAVTSCGGIYSGSYEITASQLQDKTTVSKLKHGPNLKSLLYGGRSHHKGNYVLFLSAQSAPAINKMLFDDSLSVFNKDSKVGDNTNATLSYSSFNSIQNDFKDQLQNKDWGTDLGFYWCNINGVKWNQTWCDKYSQYDPNFNDSGSAKNEPTGVSNYYEYINPYCKWTKFDESRYESNKKEWKKCKADKYVLNDGNSKSFRSIMQTDLSKLYGISGNNSFVMMQFVKGKMAQHIEIGDWNVISNDTINTSTNLEKWIIDNFNAHKYGKI